MLPRRIAFALLPFAFATLFSLPARAEPPVDQVNLANGGFVRGSVLEHDPAAGTTVLLADGTTKHYEAAEVASVRLGSEPPAKPEATPFVSPATREASEPVDDASSGFRPHLRAGLAAHAGTWVLAGDGGSLTAFSYGVMGRIGVQYAESAAVYYEPTLSFATDRGTILTTWQQIVAEWTPGHFSVAAGLGFAPYCTVTGYSYCKGDVLGTMVRLGYHSGHEDRASPGSGVFVGGELRLAFPGDGYLMAQPGFVLGWDYL